MHLLSTDCNFVWVTGNLKGIISLFGTKKGCDSKTKSQLLFYFFDGLIVAFGWCLLSAAEWVSDFTIDGVSFKIKTFLKYRAK